MKDIVIIGGGISGLALLHYLKKRSGSRSDVDVRLIEKEVMTGGTIGTVSRNGCLFETGPIGFLDNREHMLELIKDLDLKERMIKANGKTKKRFVFMNDRLRAIPQTPSAFLKTPILNVSQKWRLLKEPFIPKGINPDESLFDFGKRRLGIGVAENLLDPFVSGVYAGDAAEISLRYGFPQIYQWEQEYGSLVKAMLKTKMPKAQLTSWEGGMGSLIEALTKEHQENILCDDEVHTLTYNNSVFTLRTKNKEFSAHAVYLCTPAYAAAEILKPSWPALAADLLKINYASVTVVGLVYKREAFEVLPEGFGYLIPSKEQKKVLGVLFESNIFPNRCPDNQILLRVMLGGTRHPEVLTWDDQKIISAAKEEIQKVFSTKNDALQVYLKRWPKGIPQYDRGYAQVIESIKGKLSRVKNLHLVANYIDGISVNDCVASAYKAACLPDRQAEETEVFSS